MPDGTLAVGGDFTMAGGLPASNLAFVGNVCPAAVATVGPGCTGSGGLLQASAVTLPWLCTTFRSQCTGFAANSIGLAVFGFDSPGLPLPLLHPASGAGCTLWSSLSITELALPTGGVATTQYDMPLTPDWLGFRLYHQYLQLERDQFGGIAAIQSSNGLRLILGVP